MQSYINSVYDPCKPPAAMSLATSKTKPGRQLDNIKILSKGSGPLSHTALNRRSVTPTIYTGDAQTLLVMNRTVKRDMEEYIFEVNEFNSKDKNELTHPTGRRFVYILRLGEKDTVEVTKEMRRDMEEWIADDEDFGDISSDADGRTEPEDVVQQNILEPSPNPRRLDSQNDGVGKEIGGDFHRTLNVLAAHHTESSLDEVPTRQNTPLPEHTRPRLRRTSSTLSLAALIATADKNDFPLPDDYSETDSNSDSNPDCTEEPPAKPTFVTRPCHDPSFPGHAPCATHLQRRYGRSSKAATRVLRGRWDRKWDEGKKLRGATGVRVVQESALSCELEVMYEEKELDGGEDVISSSAIDEVDEGALVQLQGVVEEAGLKMSDQFPHGNGTRHSLPHRDSGTSYSIGEDVNSTESLSAETQDIAEIRFDTVPILLDAPTPASRMIHIRNASMNDVLSDISSTRTTVFSKQASITTKSSQSSMSVQSIKYSPLIDALDLGTGESKGRDGGSVYKFESRTLSMGNSPIPSNATLFIAKNGSSLNVLLTVRAHARDDLLLGVGSGDVLGSTESTAAVRYGSEEIDSIYPSTRARQSTGFFSPSLSSEAPAFEYVGEIIDDHQNQNEKKLSRCGKWYSKLSCTAMEIPGKAKDLAKATKRFGRTLRAFVR